jgi:hypothetical protein
METEQRLRGLSTVLVERERVLEAVKANRESHRRKFEEAIEGYKQRAIELLEEHIQRIKKKGPERVFVDLPWPTDHTEDYDRIVDQLEFSLDETLELNEQEFNTYVRDEWGWQKAFSATYSMYTQS